MIKLIFVILSASFLISNVSANKNSDVLFPYGLSNGDSAFPSPTTTCYTQNLDFEFRHFEAQFSDVMICKNGGLSMNGADGTYYVFDVHFLTVLSGDHNGRVFFRSSKNKKDLQLLSDYVVKSLKPRQSFYAQNALFITWENILQSSSVANERNTFQIILVTGSYQSYVIYNYGEIASRPVDCKFTVSFEQMQSLNQCPDSSNVNIPGRYIYMVYGDGESVYIFVHSGGLGGGGLSTRKTRLKSRSTEKEKL
jgi:hypothetical protein